MQFAWIGVLVPGGVATVFLFSELMGMDSGAIFVHQGVRLDAMVNVLASASAALFLLVNWLAPRRWPDAQRRIFFAFLDLGAVTFLFFTLAHMQITGSQNTVFSALFVLNMGIAAWILPRVRLIVFVVLTAALYFGMVGLELGGVLPYAPIMKHSATLAAAFLDWRIVLGNGALLTCAVVPAILLGRRWRKRLEMRSEKLKEVVQQRTRERDRSEAHGYELRREMARVSKAATMGRLTASLAHELGQPLTAIMNNVETARILAAAPTIDRDELSAALEDILADNRRAAATMHGMRRLFQQDEAEMATVDLNDVVREVVELTQQEASGADVQISCSLDPDLLSIEGDRVQLIHLVLNLVVNALEAIEIANSPEREIQVTTCSPDEGCAQLTVRDTGPGFTTIPPSNIFESFISTKRKGLGIGLTLARSVIQRHHGTIEADNQADGGARVTARLPAGLRCAK